MKDLIKEIIEEMQNLCELEYKRGISGEPFRFWKIKERLTKKLHQVYEAGQNEATPQYKKDMKDAYLKGCQETKRENKKEIGIIITLFSGKLYCDFGDFHEFTEKLLDKPILTSEFADRKLWNKLKKIYLADIKNKIEKS